MNAVTFQIDHFTLFGLFEAYTAQRALNFGEVYAFPNPARGGQNPTLHIEAGSSDKVEIRIYDVTGELVHSATLRGPPLIINDGQGAEQAFCTRLPDIERFDSLIEAVAAASEHGQIDKVALDNYEARGRLSEWDPSSERVTLCLGAERGWSSPERDMLRENDYDIFDLGERVLRVETAAIAATTIILAKLGVM